MSDTGKCWRCGKLRPCDCDTDDVKTHKVTPRRAPTTLREAAQDLVDQIQMSNYINEDGHLLLNNSAYDELRRMLELLKKIER